MTYRVFDTTVIKLFGAFDDEAAALRLAEVLIGDNDDDFAAELAVGHERSDGNFGEPLTGAALIVRIRELSSLREPVAVGNPGPKRS